ncbi:uncharacterized protein G2W53_009597 [Senna tora]|uniref:Uncharacterized protein n=1 Tax=Senna tora TaxID=362788 RepID=A0A834WYQ7_9FABA|nr:uncharacterized protein G2W53_009597 [Senna tora]
MLRRYSTVVGGGFRRWSTEAVDDGYGRRWSTVALRDDGVIFFPSLGILILRLGVGLNNLLEMKVDMVEVGDIMVDSLEYFEKIHQYSKYYLNVNN